MAYHLPEFREVTKSDEIVVRAKEAVDRMYVDGRTTLLGDDEMQQIIDEIVKGGKENYDNK